MKIKVERRDGGSVRIELVSDTAKRPMVTEVPAQQVPFLVQLLQAAVRADSFRFELEL